MKKKILLTGASGTIGKELFKELLKKKDIYDISLYLRSSRKNRKLFKNYFNQIKIFWGSLQNFEEVKKSVNGQDVVIHVAAALPDVAFKNPEVVVSTNVDGTQNIINAMLEQSNLPKLIYTSSVAVYGDRRKNPIIRVSDPVDDNTKDIYTSTKIKGERIVKESGLEYTIFRVSYVVAIDVLKFRPVMFYMALDSKVEIIHARDAGLAIVNAIESEELWNKTFNLGGGKQCQILFRDNVNDLFEIMGFGRDFLPDLAFSTHHSHCGFFDIEEMQALQRVLKFQNLTLEDFYNEVRKWIGFKRRLTPLVKPIIKWFILRKSDFYKQG